TFARNLMARRWRACDGPACDDAFFDLPPPSGANLSKHMQAPMDVIYRLPQRHQQQTWLRSLGISLLASILAAASAAAQEVKIEFQVLTVPPNLNISDSHSNAVIRSNRDWTIWVGNLREVPDSLPSVDFEKYTLLISNAGYKSNGPYEVKFDSVTDLPNEVRV